MRLRVNHLAKRFGVLSVLDQATMHCAAGECVAIQGASGTGKSTLLNCIGLLDRPDAGTIHLDDTELCALPNHARARYRARALGFVFQGFHLLPEFSILENILMAARCAGLPLTRWRTRALELLERVDLSDRATDPVTVLSGGERQRIAICRALLLEPALILADEPTGNLDPATGQRVLHLFRDLCAANQAAVLLVTHDSEIAATCERRYRLHSGHLHEENSGHGATT